MARTLNADLLTALTSGYPTGGYAPAIKCVLTSKDGNTTYDYSFNPTSGYLATNRLEHVQQIEEATADSGTVLLNNYDRTVSADLSGYYVDIGWGLNTSSGVKYSLTDGATSPRQWVINQLDVSGATKGNQPQIYKLLQLAGVWSAILNTQIVRIGSAPYYQDSAGVLAGQTIYGCLTYLIETALTNATGYTFLLDDLGTQDDGVINTLVPFPAGAYADPRTAQPLIEINGATGGISEGGGVNPGTPGGTQTYAQFISQLLFFTKRCYLRVKANLHFEIVFPQTSDAANVMYYSSAASGVPFYEVTNAVSLSGSATGRNPRPNHVRVYGKTNLDSATWDLTGDWYDPDNFTGSTYNGPFMEVIETQFNDALNTQTKVDDWAKGLGLHYKNNQLGSRLLIPCDVRLELYDRVEVQDQRGH